MNSIKSLAAAAAVAALLGAPAAVLAQGAPSMDPATVQAGAYAVESSHARVVWQVSHFGFSEWYGDFAGATGTAKFDPKSADANSVDISVPTASVTTTNAKLDGELKAPDWFDVEKYPTITFKSTKVVFTGPGTADVTGDLTFHGVTKPVTLKTKFKAAGMSMRKTYTVGFDATTTISRSAFGVGKYSPMVGESVEIMISVPFEKQG